MASNLYDSVDFDAITGAIDFDTDTFYALLASSSYTPDRATHSKRSSVTEITGTGYTAGGLAVTVAVAKTTPNRTTVTFSSVTFATFTATNVQYVVYYKRRGGASSADELVGYVDLGSAKSFASESLTVSSSVIRFNK